MDRRTTARGGRGCRLVHRGSAPVRPARRRGKLSAAERVAGAVGDLDGPLHPRRRPVRAHTSRGCSARDGPRRAQHVQARPAKAAAVRRGPEGSLLRDVRTGRRVARPPHGDDPRSPQRDPRRQPPRESPGRLPELQRNAPDSLRRESPSARLPRSCALCNDEFRPKYGTQLYCSRSCASRASQRSRPRVERPPYEQLLEEIATSSWSAVGRKYGVSCNAVRKWVQMEQRLRAEAAEAAARGEQTARGAGAAPGRRMRSARFPAAFEVGTAAIRIGAV